MELGVSWHQWKKMLHHAVNAAEAVGMSDERINDIACRVGQFLAEKVDPGNREQRLLNELWSEAREDEKKVLAGLIIRMVDKTEKM
ncbi:DUF3243 domain-containing protein [Desulfallas thermosapovorans]|uniref:Uncharacterized protein DUF3243 n=1 Tax=Desulfallas thermosapovorans DSM 6562 TaxID=1121431 RepID=A0A5S4ZT32_9FIRM|nr:DUF3243 domain-containing protein [Desulfallas thermosapovorans]TYO96038.1 uncharacterized protein DUF3243 [Desulfallas thermosapovorans DSM 6562]